jgi:hypothetical protein
VDPERARHAIHTPPAAGGQAFRYCLGSRRRDLLAVALSALLVLAGSPSLRVYGRVTVMDLSVMRIEPDGRRTPVAPPAWIWSRAARARAARRRPRATLRTLELRIQQVMRGDPAFAAAPPGTRFEWTIRYSENSARLDRTVVYLHPVPADVSR